MQENSERKIYSGIQQQTEKKRKSLLSWLSPVAVVDSGVAHVLRKRTSIFSHGNAGITTRLEQVCDHPTPAAIIVSNSITNCHQHRNEPKRPMPVGGGRKTGSASVCTVSYPPIPLYLSHFRATN